MFVLAGTKSTVENNVEEEEETRKAVRTL